MSEESESEIGGTDTEDFGEEFMSEESSDGGSGESVTDQFSSIWDSVTSTEPNVSLSEIQKEYECGAPTAYVLRGGFKLTGKKGIPAIVDFIMAIIIFAVSRRGNTPSQPREGPENGGQQ